MSAPVVAIVPARGGSKRIPGKNLIRVGGLPLVAHSILHARAAASVDEVIVSTDDETIAEVARTYGASVVARPAELGGDAAPSESALLHVLDERRRAGLPEPSLVVFLQCTSPVRRPGDIDGAVAALRSSGADSLLAVCENTRLIWGVRDGELVPINYDFRRRQREQDMPRQFRENGSIYVFKPEVLRRDGNRLGGRLAHFEMDYWSSFQIDTPEHVELCDWILRRPEYRTALRWPDRIALVVFDFDGVMTDNTVLVTEDGGEGVFCNRGDGLGIDRLRQAGWHALVLSKERNPVVGARAAKLRLPCLQGIDDKAPALERYTRERGIELGEVAYVGNDVNDLECLERVGLPIVVADAHPDVMPHAALVLTQPGGRGAVREVCDLLLARYPETGAAGHE